MLALLALIFNLVMTVANRRENTLYVSVWYVLGAVLWTAGVYPIGNVMWHPATGAMPGLMDSIFLWFYGHNIVGLLLTPLALAVAYFVIPRVTKTPLYSHTLSLLGFWMLVALYAHIGGHHILQAPIPNWLKTISIVDSMAMILPGRHRAGEPVDDRARAGGPPVVRPGRAVRPGRHDLVPDHVHAGAAPVAAERAEDHALHQLDRSATRTSPCSGSPGFIALGGMWHVLPLATGRRLYSTRLVHLQFALILFGLVGFFAVLTTAGLIQGAAWYQGEGVYKVLPQIAPYMALRAMLGLFIIAGAVIGLCNVVLTVRRGEPFDGLDAGGRCKTMKMTPALVVIGGLLVFWCLGHHRRHSAGHDDRREAVRTLAAMDARKEAAGHDLYVRNGCSYCHSQFVRVMDCDLGAERIAQKGDYVGYNAGDPRHRAHRPGPLAGRRRASRRLAHRAFHRTRATRGRCR